MSGGLAVPEAKRDLSLPFDDRSASGGGGRGWKAAAVVTLLALVVGIVAFLWVRSSRAASDRSQVRVIADVDALSCEGTQVTQRAPGFDDGPAIPVAAIDPQMSCTYTFWVWNRGSDTVRLERVTFPVLGPDGGAAVEAIALNTVAPNETETVDGYTGAPIDAIFDLDVDLPSEAPVEFSLHVVHRPDGCTSGGGTISFPDSPTLTLRSRGVSGSRSAETFGFGFLGHPVLNCDEP